MGESNGTSGIESGAPENPGQTAPQNVQIAAPSFGIDEKGTFHLEVDTRLGFLTILGVLQRAISFVNGAMNQQEAKSREQQKNLIKPTNKGFGRFNLFK